MKVLYYSLSKVTIPVLLTIIGTFTCNALFVEITIENEVIWSKSLANYNFYIFISCTIMLIAYQRLFFKQDRKLKKGFTRKQFEANYRSKACEEAGKRAQKLIKEGNIQQLEEETVIFTKLFGESNK